MKNLFNFCQIVLGIILLSACTKENILKYNENIASILILESDTSSIYITDYYPTMDRVDSITSSSLKILFQNTSEQFIIISETTTPILNTIEFWSGKERVSVMAIKKRGDDTPKKELTAFSSSQVGTEFKTTFLVAPEQVMVFWQNVKMSSTDYELNGRELIVRVPREAGLMKRSYMRIIASEGEKISNDLLIPLEYKRVLSDISQLDRTDKQAQVLYSLMIDRFHNGDTSNDKPLNRPDVLPTVDFKGGDIKGITDKIQSGFFTDLGINTIWMTPVAQNPDDPWGLDKDPYTKFSAYHGYWPINPTVLNPHFGTEEQLKEMLEEAHKRNINVIVDYVANHLHQSSPILKEHPDWVTPMYTEDGRLNVRLFDDERLTTWFDTFLPTLDLEKEEVREAMTDSALYWIRHYDFDGFRHDAAKHIPESYWRLLTKKIRKERN